MHLPILSISSKQHPEHIEIIHCEMRIIFIVQRNPIRLCNYIFFLFRLSKYLSENETFCLQLMPPTNHRMRTNVLFECILHVI